MKKSLKNLRRILLGLAVRTIKPNTSVSDLVNRLYLYSPIIAYRRISLGSVDTFAANV